MHVSFIAATMQKLRESYRWRRVVSRSYFAEAVRYFASPTTTVEIFTVRILNVWIQGRHQWQKLNFSTKGGAIASLHRSRSSGFFFLPPPALILALIHDVVLSANC